MQISIFDDEWKFILEKINQNVKNNDYIPLNQDERNILYPHYIKLLKIPRDGYTGCLLSQDGNVLSFGYSRVVVGDYGPYVEIPENLIRKEMIRIKVGQEFRENHKYVNIKYSWMETIDTFTKVYFQKNTVQYADYKPGFYYVSPDDVIIPEDVPVLTSYISNQKKWPTTHKPYLIVRFPPNDINLSLLQEFAPSKDLLLRYKNDEFDFVEYEKRFLIEMKNMPFEKIRERIDNDKKIILICFEQEAEMCHRSIVAKKMYEDFMILWKELY